MSIEKIEFEINKNSFKYWIVGDFDDQNYINEIESELPDQQDYNKKKLQIQKDINKVNPELRQFYSEPLLSKKQEFHIFRKMNYYKYKTKLNFEIYQHHSISTYSNLSIQFFNKYLEVRNFLVTCNTRLAAQLLKKRKDFYGDNLNDLISDCFLNIIKAVDCFDYTRGFKFSTYCTWVLMNNSLRDHMHNKKFYDSVATNIDGSTFAEKMDEKDFENCTKKEKDESIHFDIQNILDKIKKRDSREHFVIINCFGLLNQRKKTLKEISEELNLTKERVRQIRENGIKFLQNEIQNGNLNLLFSN